MNERQRQIATASERYIGVWYQNGEARGHCMIERDPVNGNLMHQAPGRKKETFLFGDLTVSERGDFEHLVLCGGKVRLSDDGQILLFENGERWTRKPGS